MTKITEIVFFKLRFSSLENTYRSSLLVLAREMEKFEKKLHDDSMPMKADTMTTIIKKSSRQLIGRHTVQTWLTLKANS